MGFNNKVEHEPLMETVLSNKSEEEDSHTGHGLVDKKNTSKKMGSLFLMMGLSFVLFLTELIAGNITNSNSLVADSFHMLSDMISLVVALVAIVYSKKKAEGKNTYGWARAEVLGSLVNSVFLYALCFSIVIEAIQRFVKPMELENVNLIFVVGALSLGVNFFGMVMIGALGGHHFHTHGHSHSSDNSNSNSDRESQHTHGHSHTKEHSHDMNFHGVFLHLMADALGSVTVIISGLLVKYVPNNTMSWKLYVDPSLSILLSLFIMVSAFPLLKESSKILMQTSRVNSESIRHDILKIDGVVEIKSFHSWSLNSEKNIATVSLCVSSLESHVCNKIKCNVKNLLSTNGIQSATVEFDYKISKSRANSPIFDSLVFNNSNPSTL